jgi:hypothetical protein
LGALVAGLSGLLPTFFLAAVRGWVGGMCQFKGCCVFVNDGTRAANPAGTVRFL